MTLLDQVQKVQHWLTLSGSGVPFIAGYGVRQWTDIARSRYPPYVIMDIAVLYVEDSGSKAIFAIDEDRYRSTARALLEGLKDLERIYADFCADEQRFDAAAARLKGAAPAEWDTAYADFVRAYDAMYSSGIMIDGFLVYGDEFVADVRTRYLDAGKAIETLTAPYGLTSAQREQRDLFLIALGPAKEADERLRGHHAAYHWIHNNYKDAQGLPLSYFEEQLAGLEGVAPDGLKNEIQRLETYEDVHRKACETIREQALFAPDDYARLLWLGKIAWWMDRRKERNLVANYFIDQYAERAAQRLGTTRETILFLLPWELDEILADQTQLSDYPIDERMRKGAVVYADENHWAVFIGPEAHALRELIDPTGVAKATELRGASASPGHARGRVRVIFDPKRETGFAQGDILVTPMTRPDFLPLMKRAGAIVTDEGGITSHAAIVSREIKKPCVIGTKVATKVLHDGDVVEVDAEKGVVRIVKRATA